MSALRGVIAGLMVALIAILAPSHPEWAFAPAIALYLALVGDRRQLMGRPRRRG